MRAITSESSVAVRAPYARAVQAPLPGGCLQGEQDRHVARIGLALEAQDVVDHDIGGVDHLAGLVARQVVVRRGEPVAGVAVGLQPAHSVGQRVHRISIHREGPYRSGDAAGRGARLPAALPWPTRGGDSATMGR